ncbi:multiple epidermal growth factor-like domains protein 6 [Mya arenaria]|uniref:multiple epidermal growth factor-like domains protein 6 n=1 Tax=Mya arenaria TaxID=6604 RepID=UPI0022E7329B|nr:multiple epidermal growth factor-like domains protein 6 [Mya arenaria]
MAFRTQGLVESAPWRVHLVPQALRHQEVVSQDLDNQADCKTCPSGYYCLAGSTNYTVSLCPSGHLLPRWNHRVHNESSCLPCTPGYYCVAPGLDAPTRMCDPGCYCESGSLLAQPTSPEGGKCLAGTYCPQGSYTTGCDPGSYCSTDMLDTVTGNCSAGYYRTGNFTTDQPTGTGARPVTDAPQATSVFPTEPCDPGTFLLSQGATVNSFCLSCTAGKYCSQSGLSAIEGDCSQGLVHEDNCKSCSGSMACDETGRTYSKRPVFCRLLLSHRSSITDTKPREDIIVLAFVVGYYCLTGAQSQTPSQGANADPCLTGSYCPDQTADPVPCPAGTFNPSLSLHSEDQFLNCIGESHCNEIGLSAVVGPCFASFYCPLGSDSQTKEQYTVGNYCPIGSEYPTPCPYATFSNVGNASVTQATIVTEKDSPMSLENAKKPTYTKWEALLGLEVICLTGKYLAKCYYCPVETEVICPIGKYCPTGTAVPQDCPAGYYTGSDRKKECQICPEGFYCVAANVVAGDISTVNTACPSALATTGSLAQLELKSQLRVLTKESECTSCIGGFYCGSDNLTSPSGPCGAGHYCTSGALSANPTMLSASQCPAGTVHPIVGDVCPIGHYCPEGTDNPIGCPAGTYQDLTTQDHCKDCPSGYYCPANTTTLNVFDCPACHYCPVNTTHATEYPCPPQTFNNLTNGFELKNSIVNGIYILRDLELLLPTVQGGHCTPGTFCPAGATYAYNCTLGMYCSQSELDTPEGFCDEGYYCPGAATSPQAESECLLCDGGFYCNGTGLSAVSGPCDAGFYCPAGQSQPDPYIYRCTPGYYCPANLYRCTPGYYCPANIYICTPGYYCPANIYRCTPGYYCPANTVENCYYQDEYQKDTCKLCPAGYFCDHAFVAIGNLELRMSQSLPCTAGYICLMGSDIATPTDNIIGYICPAGHYRLSGDIQETPCSPGTYQIQQGQDSCDICPAGRSCPDLGMNYTLPCPAGYYCLSGTQNDGEPCPIGRKYCGGEALTEPTGPCAEWYYCPAADDIGDASPLTGYLCPAGSICPANTADPIPCDPGTYQENVGKFECDACPAGYYCLSNTSVPIDCPIYSYCPESKYCTGVQIEAHARLATSVLSGIGVSDPDNSYLPNGGLCTYGFYCEEGVTTPATCPPNSFVDKEGAISQAECQPCPGGRICPENSTVSEPCWRGYYCMVTMDSAIRPNGTYNDQTGMSDSSLLCLAGYFCDEEGIANYTTKPCPLRYFCVNASIYP